MEMPVQVEALVSSFKICSRKRIAPVAAINGDLIEASFNPSFSWASSEIRETYIDPGGV